MLPGSYKLWHAYLSLRVLQVRGVKPGSEKILAVNRVFERALVYMAKMPYIWVLYIKFLLAQPLVTVTRRVCDRALRALPITQHHLIWPLFLQLAERNPQTGLKIWRRGLQLDDSTVEQYIDFLIDNKLYNEAAIRLARALDDEKFQSREGKTKHELWMTLCDVISKHPREVRALPVPAILRNGIAKFSESAGQLWVALGQYYIRLGQFEQARDVFEEAFGKVSTIQDFSLVWESYTKFEYEIIYALSELKDSGRATEEESDECELLLERYNDLFRRQKLLINSVYLRQNPNDVNRWYERVKLYEELEDPGMMLETYQTALRTIDPYRAKGKPHMLWISFARFYARNGDVESAYRIYELGVTKEFRDVEELAALWCSYVELKLSQSETSSALELCARAVKPYRTAAGERPARGDASSRRWLYKSVRLWELYADLEESFGTFQTTCSVYERALRAKVATPRMVLNYADFLEQNGYFEYAFRAYEKGVALFHFPHAMPLWVRYLTKFVAHYGGTKLERARDLFEEAVGKAPAKDAKYFYFLYGFFEENFGLARHAMHIYDRAARAVDDADKYRMYLLYIARAGEYFGCMKTRDIYERGVQALTTRKDLLALSLRYIDLEQHLDEVDRARALFVYASQFVEEKTAAGFWDKWRDFESEHGNDETLRDMLRVKRSVQEAFAARLNVTLANEMLAQRAKRTKTEGAAAPAQPAETAEQIDLGDDLNDDDNDGDGADGESGKGESDGTAGKAAESIEITEKPIPATLFGGASGGEKQLGALERFKLAQQNRK